MVAIKATDVGAPEKSAGPQEWKGKIPFRIMTATATSQPPAAPTLLADRSHGGSVTNRNVPAAMQAAATTM